MATQSVSNHNPKPSFEMAREKASLMALEVQSMIEMVHEHYLHASGDHGHPMTVLAVASRHAGELSEMIDMLNGAADGVTP